MSERDRPSRLGGYPYTRHSGGGERKVYISERKGVPDRAEPSILPESEDTRPAAAEPIVAAVEEEVGEIETLPEEEGIPEALKAAAEDMSDYLEKNSATGLLKIEAYRAREALPAPGVRIRVSGYIGETEQEFFSGLTDANGLIDNIRLPAPPRAQSLKPTDAPSGAPYLLTAEAEGYLPIVIGITVFDKVKTIQPLPMLISRGEERNA